MGGGFVLELGEFGADRGVAGEVADDEGRRGIGRETRRGNVLRLFLPFPFHVPIVDRLLQNPVRIPYFVSHVTVPSTITLLLASLANMALLHPYLGL